MFGRLLVHSLGSRRRGRWNTRRGVLQEIFKIAEGGTLEHVAAHREPRTVARAVEGALRVVELHDALAGLSCVRVRDCAGAHLKVSAYSRVCVECAIGLTIGGHLLAVDFDHAALARRDVIE